MLCRLHGRPVGFVRVPIEAGGIATDVLIRELIDEHAKDFIVPLAERAVAMGRAPGWPDVESLFQGGPEKRLADPHVTVAVCTRDRTTDLHACLDALLHVDYPNVELLVVDNAPSSDATRRLVADRYPQVRYVREPRPGLDWARNRAILETRSDILAFTDDDVVVDPGWVTALVRVFLADPEVMAVTGLVMPHELTTDAQHIFESYGGFGRGFARRWFRAPANVPVASAHAGTGKFGTGANMAFWRRVFDDIGGFDPALDVGTCTNGGGDLEMFFRVLKAGHTLVYEHSAIVRHRHRRTYAELRTQIANNGVGFYSFLSRTASAYPDERRAVIRFGAYWLWWWNVRRLLRGLLRKEPVPIDLTAAELRGSIAGLRRYPGARRRAGAIAAAFPGEPLLKPGARSFAVRARRTPEALRQIDLSTPLSPIDDAKEYERLRVVVSWEGTPIGTARIAHHGAVVSVLRLRDEIARQLGAKLLDARMRLGSDVLEAGVVSGLAKQLVARAARVEKTEQPAGGLPPDVTVSVVVATYDRPADLRRCLDSLLAQRTSRPLEIIVVDNHPASGVTRTALSEYSGITLVAEERGGLSYARNRGIAAARGRIIATTDDDVVCPPDWIERLMAPFRQADVMVVTGNVLPLQVDSEAQRMFEVYGGLGRGFTKQRVDGRWFRRWRRAVPTWELGCTANAAFRADIFTDPDIGLMDEALGAGTPTGCSEDTYVFYRVLKAGYAIAYEPEAFVWHRHRDSVAALRRQIYSYSKGHVAYQLTTLLRDRDPRALVRLGYELPCTYSRRAWERLRGRGEYPLSFVGLEILGTLAGPFALWRSRLRVHRLGRSRMPGARPRETAAGPAAAA